MAHAHDTLSVRHYGASPGSHAHSHFQVLVGLEGSLELEVEGRGRRVSRGQGLVIAPGDRHDFESALGARCLVLDSADMAWRRLSAVEAQADVASLAHYLAGVCDTRRPLATLTGPALLLEAWAPGAAAPVPRIQRPIDWSRLRRWALERIDTPLSVADLAAQVHLSEAQFGERCRRELQSSPMAWLRGLRLHTARQLRASGLPVSEVALRCGYRSPSALTAALRRLSAGRPGKFDD